MPYDDARSRAPSYQPMPRPAMPQRGALPPARPAMAAPMQPQPQQDMSGVLEALKARYGSGAQPQPNPMAVQNANPQARFQRPAGALPPAAGVMPGEMDQRFRNPAIPNVNGRPAYNPRPSQPRGYTAPVIGTRG